MSEDRWTEALQEALGWINAAFVGHPQDVRSWPVLDPLAPHALTVARRADEEEIGEPAGRLYGYLGLLSLNKGRYNEAKPFLSRAVDLGETDPSRDDNEFAGRLNNLAQLLQHTNRLAEAEPLMRRALAIGETSHGPDHPMVAIRLNNLALLLRDTNRLAEAEPMMRRALAIDETIQALIIRMWLTTSTVSRCCLLT